MDKRSIEAVFFDLGETLLIFGRIKRKPLIEEAVQRSYAFLKELGQPVGSYRAYRLLHLWGMRWHFVKSWHSGADFDSLELLKSFGRKKGFQLSEEQWVQLNWQWYQGLSQTGSAPSGTAQALDELGRMGLQLGLLSNTFIHKSSLERHMESEGILDKLPLRLYSYDFPWRKPDVRIFQQAAERIGVAPEKIVYVGDRMDNDVCGALKAGMLPVLVHAYTNAGKKIPANIPYIKSVAQLPQLLTELCDCPVPPKAVFKERNP